MKHLTNSRESKFPATAGNALLKLLRAALLLLLSGFAISSASAQCNINCRGSDPGQPLAIYIDGQCEARLDTNMLLTGPSLCPGDKILTVRDTLNAVIASGTNEVAFDAIAYHGQVLRVIVRDAQSGLFCNSFITLRDTFPPEITCAADTVNCLADTSVASLGYPFILDNCSGDMAVNYADTLMSFPCAGPEAALIERTWRARDIFGNITTCVQPIYLRRPSLTDIRFPADTAVSCESGFPDADVAGWPTLFGDLIGDGNDCFLEVDYEDEIIPACLGLTYEVLRIWTVTETCSGLAATEIQLVSVVDTVAPEITCPPPLTASTSPGSCYARVNLSMPTYMDNCDSDATFYVSTSFGAVGLGPHNFVPVGTHTIQYTAIDACQNTRTCTSTLNVVDAEPPIVVCNQAAIVSVPTGGYGTAPAAIFNEGSMDNCTNTLYFKAKRVDAGACNMANGDDSGLPGFQEWFDDEVNFCCEDIDEGVQLLLHVYAINPGPGPVDPTREQPGGDLYGHFSECTVNVEVQDGLEPALACPHDTVIDCSTDYTDLSVFGNPMFSDNCSSLVSVVEDVAVNDCGAGSISRTFQAIDPSGNVSTCTQVISIVNQDQLSEDNIIWPADYTASICGASTEPDDLPDGFSRPKLVDQNCSNAAVLYEDDLFNIAMPACYKILRRWTVIDWCHYDPEYPDSGGRFSKVQIIKVEDNDAPVLECPPSITRGVSSGCSSATVSIPLVTAIDCNPNLIITNDSPYALSGGANASGDYPAGTTVVTFSAADRCGNSSTCVVNINVVDNRAPAPVCIVGLSVNLSGTEGEGMAVLPASAFDGGSTDNCTASAGLRRTIRLTGTGAPGIPPAATELAFTCADRGNRTVEFWVTDEAGNSDHCVTVVAVQDNNQLCPQQASGRIAGDIQTEEGEYVDNVMVQAGSTGGMESYTGNYGFFELQGVPYGRDYSVSAYREDELLNGVSTFDLVLVSKHILGQQRLDSPYKQIAADVNNSGSVTTLDMISMRKMILGVDNRFPNGNTSWRFVDAYYVFPDPEDAFAAPFPEAININNFSRDEMDADFVAIKVGDVDNSAAPNRLLGAEGRVLSGGLAIRLPDQRLKGGELITVPFTAARMEGVLGYQFSLSFAAEALELVNVQPGSLPGMAEDNFNLQMAGEGWLSTSWHRASEASAEVPAAPVLFSLVFRAKKEAASLEPLLRIGNLPTPAEAYDAEGRLMGLDLQFEKAPQARQEGIELYQNRPNPFTTETAIGFRLPKSGPATLSVFSLSGKLAYRQEAYFEQGYHEVMLSAESLPGGGVFYYQLETANQTAARKMIILR